MINLFFIMTLTIMMGLILGLTPYVSRKNFPFGVSLPVTKETEKVINYQKKTYFMINFGLSLILGIGILILSLLKNTITKEMVAYLSTTGLFIILIVSLVTYVMKHKEMKVYKQSLNLDKSANQKILVDLSFRKDKLIFPTSYLVAMNLVFILITTLVTVLNYDKIPDRMVTQWGLDMTANSYTEKTWLSVLAIPVMQVFMMVIIAISNHAFLSAKQQLDRNNPEVSSAKNKKFRKQSSLINYIISLLTQLLFMLIQFSIIFQDIVSPKLLMILSIGFTVIIIGIVLWYSLRYGQSGDRLKHIDVSGEKEITEETLFDDNDEHWKLGMIYFNKQDPSFWVEKRMGVGMTFNMAKWQGWVFIISTILIPIAIAYFMMM